MAFLIGGANSAAADTGYNIANSLRFNDGDSAYLDITPGAEGDRTKWTISAWVKRGALGIECGIMGTVETTAAGDSGARMCRLKWDDDDNLGIFSDNPDVLKVVASAKHRDPSAWYHIVCACDTTQATDINRLKFYVNGTQLTSFGTTVWPAEDAETGFGYTHAHRVGWGYGGGTEPLDGDLADFYFIDGTQYDADDFGETDEDSGIWKPKEADVTFGTNGFFLEFKQTGTSADASGKGADTSGEDNHLDDTNLAVTDQTTDTPTNNFCTMNPLGQGGGTLAEGNLKETTDDNAGCPATFAVSNGKWYWELEITAGSNNLIGIADADYYGLFATTPPSYGILMYQLDGRVFNMGSTTQAADAGRVYDTNDIMGIRLDLDSGTRTIKWYEDDALIATENIGASQVLLTPASSKGGSSQTCSYNFGNPSFTVSSGNADANGYGNFEYAVPSGHYALCTKNLAEFG